MNIALRELWQIGFLHVLFYPSHFLFYIGWAAVVLGGLIQWMLLKKAKCTGTKWVFAGLLLFGLLAGETGYQTIIGWDQLLPLFGYWICLMLLLGSGAAWVLHRFFQKTHSI